MGCGGAICHGEGWECCHVMEQNGVGWGNLSWEGLENLSWDGVRPDVTRSDGYSSFKRKTTNKKRPPKKTRHTKSSTRHHENIVQLRTKSVRSTNYGR